MIRCSINPNQETDLVKIKILVHVKIDLVISENQKCLLSVYMNVCTFVVWICKVYTLQYKDYIPKFRFGEIRCNLNSVLHASLTSLKYQG